MTDQCADTIMNVSADANTNIDADTLRKKFLEVYGKGPMRSISSLPWPG